jgi:hypothetical protein
MIVIISLLSHKTHNVLLWMMMRTLTLVMMAKKHQMTMFIMNRDPRIPMPQLVVLPCLESLGCCNLALFKGVNHYGICTNWLIFLST